jgi:methyl-accepting chemotaxis protein
VADASKSSDRLFDRSIAWIAAMTVAALLIGVAVAVLITRGLLRQLGGEPDYAAEIADHIAKGDLAIDIRTKEGDRSSLLASMKEMRDNLAHIVGEIREGAHTIAAASGQIASGNADLSARTEEQAGSLEETASAMEELTARTRPTSLARPPRRWPRKAAAWSARWSRPWARSTPPRARFSTSSASSTASPSRPIFSR